MKVAYGTGLLGLALGFAAGWVAHTRESVVIYRPLPSLPPFVSNLPPPSDIFPAFPKPSLETPIPTVEPTSERPTPLGGDISSLPSANPNGEIGPLAPELPNGVPPSSTDLNADEALVRSIVLRNGGEIVSSGEARDVGGTVGRSLIVETDPSRRDGLRAALRSGLGTRAIISDAGGGSSPVNDPTLKRAEDDLAAARKKRDQARIDFLPASPILRDAEEEALRLERTVATQRKKLARVRLSILIRPTL